MTIKNGDLPAMPITPRVDYMHIKDKPYCNGLTKREQFASMAMQGLLSSNSNWRPNVAAEIALLMADALLAELEKAK